MGTIYSREKTCLTRDNHWHESHIVICKYLVYQLIPCKFLYLHEDKYEVRTNETVELQQVTITVGNESIKDQEAELKERRRQWLEDGIRYGFLKEVSNWLNVRYQSQSSN